MQLKKWSLSYGMPNVIETETDPCLDNTRFSV